MISPWIVRQGHSKVYAKANVTENVLVDCLVAIELQFINRLVTRFWREMKSLPESKPGLLDVVLIGGIFRRADSVRIIRALMAGAQSNSSGHKRVNLHIHYGISLHELLIRLIGALKEAARTDSNSAEDSSIRDHARDQIRRNEKHSDLDSDADSPESKTCYQRLRNRATKQRLHHSSNLADDKNPFKVCPVIESDAMSQESLFLGDSSSSDESYGETETVESDTSGSESTYDQLKPASGSCAARNVEYYEKCIQQLKDLATRVSLITVFVSDVDFASVASWRSLIGLLMCIYSAAPSLTIRIMGGITTSYSAIYSRFPEEFYSCIQIFYYDLGSTNLMITDYWEAVASVQQRKPAGKNRHQILDSIMTSKQLITKTSLNVQAQGFCFSLRFAIYCSVGSTGPSVIPRSLKLESGVELIWQLTRRLLQLSHRGSVTLLDVMAQMGCVVDHISIEKYCCCRKCRSQKLIIVLYSLRKMGLVKCDVKQKSPCNMLRYGCLCQLHIRY
eukprot:Gregarina_sp_Poly_1__1996@NODE_1523_length_3932_cov_99_149547_g1007_i0_p1_GENE_NODE_1523_length_3932_cov_99_149547_g1007_i0NODE_1523_length_3932_cov_99_149547_g1007_i0_p1_ORF_typecomplete_len505_score31_87Pox_Ag35/PF03286_14/0_0099ORC3_N/PF07034_11/0_033_NODE_1523_length_3932_cov_99_149547_g1007_i012212735